MNLLRGPTRLILKLLGWKLLDRPQRPANVTVVMAAVDYGKRKVSLLSSIMLSSDAAADMSSIAAGYEGRRGYHLYNASPIRLL